MRYPTLLLCTLTAACLLVSVASGDETAQKKRAPSLESINGAMQRFVDEGIVSGAVTLVGHEGAIAHLGAVGVANLESDEPMKTSSLFSIASMTKPVVATAIMILHDQGRLSVDDNVSKYLPEFANVRLENGEAPAREITIRDALTHTAGLSGSQLFAGTLAEGVDELAQRPLAFQPGTKWQYSPGLNVAGRIVEVVAEQPLQTFLQEQLFDPLRMQNTTFYPDDKQRGRIATLYGLSEDKQSLTPAENHITDLSEERGPNPSGGLISSARDLFRFYRMVLDEGSFRKQRILSADAVRMMTSPQTGDLQTGFTPGNCWGLGWCIIREPQGVTATLSPGTFGHGGAFGTQGWVDPKTKTIYVLMIQRTQLGNSDGSELRETFQRVANEALGI